MSSPETGSPALPLSPPSTPPSQGRAGRDLPAAVAVGLLLGAAVVVSLFIKPLFVGLAAAAVAVGLWELRGALGRKRLHLPWTPLAVGSALTLWAAYVQGAPALLLGLGVTAVLGAGWQVLLRRGGDAAPRDFAGGWLALAYLPLLAGFAVLLARPDDGARRVVLFVLLVVCNDVGGYAAGVLWGRHPIAPAVSPKKSWEGAAGSVALCTIAACVAVPALVHGPWTAGLLLGPAAMVSATLGDFAESALKRDLGIKDMSALLPGHGGLLDRLDSLLATAPVAYVLLTWLVPPGGS